MAKAILGVAFYFLLVCPVFSASPAKPLPNWSSLSMDQQAILAPLSDNWDGLNSRRKKMWVDIATRYPTMSPEDQTKVQRRMNRWVNLSQDERRTVRETYKTINQLPKNKKETLSQEWDEYIKLPEEQRKRLASSTKASKGVQGQSRPSPGDPKPPPEPVLK